MALNAVFIGINRYRDPGLFDLHGARVDAVALEALFADSVPGLAATLIVDAAATLLAVTGALRRALGDAGPDDQVLVSFSGHGARTHHLVLHDSDPRDAGTMLAMEELAALFRSSPARSILGIIDCCFSGEAPARVVSDGPRPRGPLGSLPELFSGKGRMLIAASSPTEAAWEHPGKGHGLLTKAIIDVLVGAHEPVDLGAATDDIVRIVQAEAHRIGNVQTPVFVNFSEGGMRLPSLSPGPKYAAAFPDRSAIRVSSNLDDLSKLGIDARVINAWRGRFPHGLNDLQLRAVNDEGVLSGKNVLAVAPTGAGKTFIGEMAAIRAVNDNRRAAFLLPYRAIVNEKYEDFRDLYADMLGLRVIRCTGDYQDDAGAFIRGRYDFALLTYEMFLNLCVVERTALHHLGLVVLDEAQFITDPRRGITVELLLTLLVTGREFGIAPQIVALSAVIGDINGFDRWLDAGRLITSERPVPLLEGVIDRLGTFQYVDTDGCERTEQFLPAHVVTIRRETAKTQDLIVPLVRKLIDDGESVIVFRNQRGKAEGCARYLARELRLPSGSEVAELSQLDPSSTTLLLRECMAHGVACHNSNLTREERVLVERWFRRSDGGARVMAATTTLAAGINTPASTVILAEQEFLGEDGRPFTVAEYKNMAGRAGRPGYGRPGRAVIYAETPQQRVSLMRKYVHGRPEPIASSFDVARLDTWILRLLGQVKEVPRADVSRLLVNTFAGYAATLNNPNWRTQVEGEVQATIAEMLTLELLDSEGGLVHLTLLGRACGRSALSFRSAMRLVGLLRQFGSVRSAPSPSELMVFVQTLEEVEETYTPIMPNARAEKALPSRLAGVLGDAMARSLQRHASDTKTYLQRCKRCLVLLDWIAGLPTEEIERRYSPSPFAGKIALGHIRGFADTTRFHLRAAAEIAQVLYPTTDPAAEDLEALLRSLEVGVPADVHDLLPFPLARGELLVLRSAGITTREQLRAATPDRLRELLGPRFEAIDKLRSAT